ncbi:MAG: phospho-N-acetylmuramoyl-pentapeptide-transferase [Candidatus Synechococcus spongiarum 15L]|uniref:Phospho-N-acetylmuramoyl-pentapeptide-transferase n=1 Tax=Candidatus Synechococcus spongiarum 15L TaxID=1608419 RepID=A0A0G8AWK5_9SYNE|nr:MAG: phospho-N-acetylmuramoyl-pentapeptide-transferase [Candidatus Synechococcus spongiarum 15L]
MGAGHDPVASSPRHNLPGSGATWAVLLIGLALLAALLADHHTRQLQLGPLLLLAGLVSAVVCGLGIPILRRLRMGQTVRVDGPRNHQSKSGTPTMAGLLLVPCGVVLGGWVDAGDGRLLLLAATGLGFMAIGGLDDWQSLRQKKNQGLRASTKLLLQGLVAVVFLAKATRQGWLPTQVSFPFGGVLELGPLIWPLGLWTFLAESNATNLMDGLDGLAAGCGAIVLLGMAIQLMVRGNGGDPALAGFAAALAGAYLGFLVHNRRPAKAFMGDTGSLALGGVLAGLALLSDSLWALLVMGAVPMAESFSVVLQVGWFKLSRRWWGQPRRLLRMAPLHHHFELSGYSEVTVVVGFWLATAASVVLGLLLLAG